MQLRKIVFLLLLGFPFLAGAQAQMGQVQGYLGPAMFPSSKQELLSGFNTGITVGAGVSRTIKKKFIFNPNIEFTSSSKEHYAFSLLSIHNNFKYYPLLLSKIRPYAMIAGNISFVNLHQQAFTTIVTPDASYYGNSPSNIAVNQVIYREPDLKLQFSPTFGLGAGIGIEGTVKLKFVPFIQYSLVNYFSSSSSLINTNFKNNTSNLSIQNIVIGVRYNLYKK
jgi:hypothetical protein